jgi:hemin uptake protein HemP
VSDDSQNKKPADSGADRRPIAAHELFRGQREVSIRFRGDVYRLRITRNDKLILTK